MRHRITYLLGAGASAQKLPIVNGMNTRLETWCSQYIPDFVNQFGSLVIPNRNGETIGDGLKILKDDFAWLLSESTGFLTIDTLAKKYFLTNDSESLLKLKAILSIFFTLEQVRVGVDPRYDLFWASVLESEIADFRDNSGVNIISWNYDSQVEKSLMKFSMNREFRNVKGSLQIFPFAKKEVVVDPKRFSLIKLNGTADTHNSPEGLKQLNYWQHKTIVPALLENLLYFYQTYKHQPEFLYPELSFAWENSPLAVHLRNQAKAACADTEILIIIGYSFPFFNRKIDREILGVMGSLKQVYIQAAESGHSVRDRFSSFLPEFKEITVLTDKDQFYIPYQY